MRPEAAALLRRWREVAAAAALALAGLWLSARGGPFWGALGATLAAAGAGLVWIGLRRLRFRPSGDAPGVVEIVEGQIGYFGPGYGGYAALSDVTELRLVEAQGRRAWAIAQEGGFALFIPVEAEGALALFDAFASLPGLDPATLIAALDRPGPPDRLLWRRDGRLRLPEA